MKITDVNRIVGINLPDYFGKYAEEFENIYDSIKDEEFLTSASLEKLINEGFVKAEAKDDIERVLEAISSDHDLDYALKFLYFTMCEKLNPWQNHLYETPAPPTLGDDKFVFPLILMVKTLENGIANARNNGISEDYVAQLKGVFSYATHDRGDRWEMKNIFHWHMTSAMGMMYLIGRIKYEPTAIDERYLGLRRKSDGALLFVLRSEADIDEYGQFCRSGAKVEFKTSYTEANDYITANPMHPSGRVLKDKVTLSLNEWYKEIDGGMALSMHIPSGEGYNAEQIGKSFREALVFYNKIFPNLVFSCFSCYSWLYSPQLSELLPYESGINTFNRTVYICPVPSDERGFYTFVFKTKEFDPETADTSTTLKRNFVDFVKSGRRAHNGLLYYPISMLDTFGEEIRYPL